MNRNRIILFLFTTFILLFPVNIYASGYCEELISELGTARIIDQDSGKQIAWLERPGEDVEPGAVTTKKYVYFCTYRVVKKTYDMKEDNECFLYRYDIETEKTKRLLTFPGKQFDYYRVGHLYKNKLYIMGYVNGEDTAEFSYDLKTKKFEKVMDDLSHQGAYKQYIIMSNAILLSSDYHAHPVYVYNIETKRLKKIMEQASLYYLDRENLLIKYYVDTENGDRTSKEFLYNVATGKKEKIDTINGDRVSIYRLVQNCLYGYNMDKSEYFKYNRKTKVYKKISLKALNNALVGWKEYY